ncbi:MAG: cyclic nucleotide-binding domain-containing protein [Kofleriaceae bacterium]
MNRRAFVLGSVMLLLASLVAVALRSFAEATFLEAYGARQAPWLLIASAIGFALATLGYDRLTRLAHPLVVDLGLLVVLGVVSASSPALLDHGTSPIVIVIALTAASQVANLALWNRVAAAVAGREARRMLPRAGAAVTLGGAIAGLGAGAVIPRLGLSFLPYAAAAATAIVIGVCVAQDRVLVAGGTPGAAAPAAPAQSMTTIQHQLLAALITVAALEAIVTTVIDLQFIANVKSHYAGNALAVALALFYGGTNAILFVLQIAAVPRILVTRSLPFTAAIHPALVIVSYLGFAASPGFVAIAGTRTTDQVLRLATSRTSQELAMSALPPGPRARWKVLLRGLIYPAGAAIAAYVLFLLGPAVLRSPTHVAAAAITIAAIWGIAARIAARRFQSALAAPLGIKEVRREDPRRIDVAVLERWTHAAGSGDPRSAALARAALTRARVDATDLADHLRHDEADVRAALFDQLVRAPVAALRGELRAAVAIEDDARALALGIQALTRAGDDAGLARGKARAGLSRELDDVTRTAALVLRPADSDALDAELATLLERDPIWAIAVARARRAEISDDALARILRTSARAGAELVAVRVGPPASLAALATALEAGEPTAVAAIASIGELEGDTLLALDAALPAWSALARATVARALAGAPAGNVVVARLVDDRDPEVAHAALRTALAFARGGTALAHDRITAAFDAARAALVAHLDARDAAPESWSPCVRAELEIATRRCVARTLWASAVEAAAAGRDAAPLAATARRLISGNEAEKKRALDVAQELQARPKLLAAIERWLLPPRPGPTLPSLAPHDAWLARLVAGELEEVEPALVALRRPALFASIAGPALAELAARSATEHVTGTLFEHGAAGETMYIVTAGALLARRDGEPDRRIEPGAVVGELAVLTHARRAATVVAVETGADVVVIDRATFAAASRRAPELVLGLSATLAGWLAPNRPDVL